MTECVLVILTVVSVAVTMSLRNPFHASVLFLYPLEI